MDVSVFGTGYVGLLQAAALAAVGHRARRVDIGETAVGRRIEKTQQRSTGLPWIDPRAGAQ
ncbi:hypothetical protein V4939_01655 [Azotobacter vinelandii DJ]|uniref:hypothetical protein n=1 Tax=Azotobacter sp. NL3 TaxID=3083257 RepID=UPI000045A61C|nr:hypothetical protein [Azotobacter vinelandii]WKN24637.1 hypothetical protein AVAEIV_000544 [Azotobacter vinelandii]GLK60210.1 hypothetical protein GCM10017624_23690 [Azotobacter vinelandii]SFX67641.1 UDP-glucose/GDP-mannose dehydrogenase family, NAD binding domain [Azotobacter vinelandii]